MFQEDASYLTVASSTLLHNPNPQLEEHEHNKDSFFYSTAEKLRSTYVKY